MTEQAKHSDSTVNLNPIMKILPNRLRKKYHELFQIISFYSRDFHRIILALLAISIVLGLMETFQIVLLYPILNATFNLQDQGGSLFEPLYNLVRNAFNLPDIVSFCLLFILLVFLTFVVSLVYKYLSVTFTREVINKTKRAIFNKIMTNDYRYFVETQRGDILYTVVSAPDKIRDFLDYATSIFSDFIIIVTILIMMLFVSVPGVILMVVGGLVFIQLFRYVGKKVAYRLGKLRLWSVQSENEVIQGYVQGIRQIRSVSGDAYWKEKYNGALRNYWDKYSRYNLFKFLPNAILQFFFFSIIGVIVIFLFYLYQEDFLYIIPVLGTFAFSALKVLPRASNIGNNYMYTLDAFPNLERVYYFLNDSRYTTIKNGTKVFKKLSSDIVFDNVSFSYYKHQEMVESVNLTIRKNKITALVGHSGSGKSTLISLLLRYYDVSNGRILVNGIDLPEYDLTTYLQKIGYVSQDTFIYHASVRENIAFGGEFSDDQIIRSAEKANIHPFIVTLPNGYDTIVGDQGLTLSGGEKQRIAIARALVREPEILVLDEATSNLDNKSEAIVQDSINRVSENVTVFVIAHRLSTIRKADTIYVMRKGRIIESGTHDELMQKQEAYFELYQTDA
jgi:ABC-type multidrug transport system fused ATPase/permease subunit